MGDKWYQRDWVDIRHIDESHEQREGGFRKVTDVDYLTEDDIDALVNAGVVARDAQ